MACELLARYPLFGLLTPPQLDALVSTGEERTFSTGETIFQEGSAGVLCKNLVCSGTKTNSVLRSFAVHTSGHTNGF